MKRIAYAEEWLTTDDRVADLVLEYAQALARNNTADTVAIPVVEDGSVRRAQFLVGPASQIIVVDTDEEAPASLDARAAVADLEARLARLRSPEPVLYETEPVLYDPDDDLPGTAPDL